MTHGDDVKQSHKIATAALMALKQHDLPATPAYFHLWYNYYANTDPALRAALDTLVADDKPIAATACDMLYDRFVEPASRDGTMLDTSAKLESVLGEVLQTLSSAGSDSERFGTILDHVSGNLSGAAGDLDTLQALVETLARETRSTLQQNRQLQERLQASSVEIGTLRSHLEEVRREATTDALTGIGNRKQFDIKLREAIEQAMHQGADLCLLMLDIDHFKRFNDKHGHVLGDQVLRQVARCLTECVKGRDVAARYGGEEFAVILPGTSLDDAVTVAEQIRKNVACKRIVRRRTDEVLGGITMSIGVAQFMAGEKEQSLVQRADQALYAAKKAGRNRTATEADIEPATTLAAAS